MGSEYGGTTIDLGMSITESPLTRRALDAGFGLLAAHLGRAGFKAFRRDGVVYVDAPVKAVAPLIAGIREHHPLGGSFDFAVRNGEEELRIDGNAAERALKEYFEAEYADAIAAHATRALLYEVATTPKPGLVDRVNSGAHRDMGIFTFIDSSVVLTPYFRGVTRIGMAFGAPPCELLPRLRYPGQWAEDRMFAATGGVNTHKGLVFSLGIVCAGLGVLHARSLDATAESLSRVCAEIAAETPRELDAGTREAVATHGEKAYARFGVKGVRGEAAAGYPHVLHYGYPVLKKAVEQYGCSLNDAGVVALLHLMEQVEDTNIVARSDPATLREVQREVGEFLRDDPDPAACLAFAGKLDKRFIRQNLSPGGCADLLALSYLFYFVLQ